MEIEFLDNFTYDFTDRINLYKDWKYSSEATMLYTTEDKVSIAKLQMLTEITCKLSELENEVENYLQSIITGFGKGSLASMVFHPANHWHYANREGLPVYVWSNSPTEDPEEWKKFKLETNLSVKG